MSSAVIATSVNVAIAIRVREQWIQDSVYWDIQGNKPGSDHGAQRLGNENEGTHAITCSKGNMS